MINDSIGWCNIAVHTLLCHGQLSHRQILAYISILFLVPLFHSLYCRRRRWASFSFISWRGILFTLPSRAPTTIHPTLWCYLVRIVWAEVMNFCSDFFSFIVENIKLWIITWNEKIQSTSKILIYIDDICFIVPNLKFSGSIQFLLLECAQVLHTLWYLFNRHLFLNSNFSNPIQF